MKSKVRGTILPLRQAEFDALPDSVQRKCFSSLERLQIQQQARQATGEPTSGRSSQAHRPSLSLGTGRRKPTSETPAHEHAISHADVDFFFSLPAKVRKQHFSRQEQLLLQAWREHALLLADPEWEWAQQRFDDFHFGFSHSPVADVVEHRRAPRRSSSSSAANLEHGPGGPCTAPEKVLDSASPPLYLDTMATPIFTRRQVPVVDMRRTMSLTAHSVRRGAEPLAMSEPQFAHPLPARQHQRAHSSSLSGRRSFQTSTAPVFDPDATHYQDPEARKKLRMYLACPQKFDEAIEFGFPSSAGHNSAAPHYHLPQIHSHSHGFSRDMHTFLRDRQLSFFEDNNNDNQGLESDADSVADMETPATPSSTGLSFGLHSRQISHRNLSIDSPAPSPVPSANGQLNREMTLRMTLTRPDLRADEDELYGRQGASSSPKSQKDDPLALEDLVFSDDMTGTKGAFYVKPKPRGNLVSRLLKRASLKSR